MSTIKFLDSNDKVVDTKPNDYQPSPKYGDNPCNITCFMCGKESGVLLIGLLPNDRKAPEQILIDYTPCDHCKVDMAKGVTLVGVHPTPTIPGQPSINQEIPVYPTGHWVTLPLEEARKIITNGDELTRGQIIFIDNQQLLDKL